MTGVEAPSAAEVAMGLAGGLALFLLGMGRLTDALKSVAGEGMRALLQQLTRNRFGAALAGATVTAVIQSSSVTTVLVVGFVSAGLMTLSQSIGVIMGANIGTTVTAQIIAFKVTHYGLFMVAVGFALQVVSERETPRQVGSMLLGLGLVFFGMELMGDATRPLRSQPFFLDLMARMASPLWGVMVGALFTAVVQSSSATTGIVIVLASQGLIRLEAGIALALGANVGTCVTALLSALGKPREAVRAATIHVLFNALGVVLWVGFVPQLADLVRWLSPAVPDLIGVERLAAETPRQVANAHTLFNVANTLLFIGFTGPLARLTEWLVPETPVGAREPLRPRYLDDALLGTPTLALDRVRLELGRLGECALEMLRRSTPVVVQGRRTDLEALRSMDDDVDRLHGAIVEYLGRMSKHALRERESARAAGYLAIANYIENVGDTIETNLVGLGLERLSRGVRMSETTLEVLRPLTAKVSSALALALQALLDDDAEKAASVIEMKREVGVLADAAKDHLAGRLRADAPRRLWSFRVESDLIEMLQRLYYFAKRIAKQVASAREEPVSAEAAASAAPDAGAAP